MFSYFAVDVAFRSLAKVTIASIHVLGFFPIILTQSIVKMWRTWFALVWAFFCDTAFGVVALS